MKRLTETRAIADGVKQFRRIGDEHWLTFDAPEVRASPMMTAIQRLAEYEDGEEQGRLVMLPVKIGQKVYRHQYTGKGDDYCVVEWTVSAIEFLGGQMNLTFRRGDEFFHCEYGGANWRVTYMTREEAEATLEELNALSAKARAEAALARQNGT